MGLAVLPVMKKLSTMILVVAIAIATACFGGKRSGRGTNVGTGSGDWPPGQGGQSPALTGSAP